MIQYEFRMYRKIRQQNLGRKPARHKTRLVEGTCLFYRDEELHTLFVINLKYNLFEPSFGSSRRAIRRHGRRSSHATRATPGAVASCGPVQPVLAANHRGHVCQDDVHHRLLRRILLFHIDYAVAGEGFCRYFSPNFIIIYLFI